MNYCWRHFVVIIFGCCPFPYATPIAWIAWILVFLNSASVSYFFISYFHCSPIFPLMSLYNVCAAP